MLVAAIEEVSIERPHLPHSSIRDRLPDQAQKAIPVRIAVGLGRGSVGILKAKFVGAARGASTFRRSLKNIIHPASPLYSYTSAGLLDHMCQLVSEQTSTF
jgi:hypothetical protein